VKNVELKIVGSITDENALEEIQSIAKVVVYEQRMKEFKYPLKTPDSFKKEYIKHYRKNNTRRTFINDPVGNKFVRGLC
jgi:hypothetical protein